MFLWCYLKFRWTRTHAQNECKRDGNVTNLFSAVMCRITNQHLAKRTDTWFIFILAVFLSRCGSGSAVVARAIVIMFCVFVPANITHKKCDYANKFTDNLCKCRVFAINKDGTEEKNWRNNQNQQKSINRAAAREKIYLFSPLFIFWCFSAGISQDFLFWLLLFSHKKITSFFRVQTPLVCGSKTCK